ncbi:MAG TPA: hypothetical protein VFB74_09605 [Kribbellaceae bacterium]|nr:hypothetical protein [Kribbellaceae bacterium]
MVQAVRDLQVVEVGSVCGVELVHDVGAGAWPHGEVEALLRGRRRSFDCVLVQLPGVLRVHVQVVGDLPPVESGG